ncbi:hypothetical protein OS21_18310 [Dickeya oryzae]
MNWTVSSRSRWRFFERTRARYQQLAAADNSIVTVDASRGLEEVNADIRRVLRDWLQRLTGRGE